MRRTPGGFIDALRARSGAVAGHQARIAAHLAAQLRHPPARTGVDIRLIQVLLSHSKLETTALYMRPPSNTIRDVTSPLERSGC